MQFRRYAAWRKLSYTQNTKQTLAARYYSGLNTIVRMGKRQN